MLKWFNGQQLKGGSSHSRVKAVISHDTPSGSNNTTKVEMDGHVAQRGEKRNVGKHTEGSHLEDQERDDRTL